MLKEERFISAHGFSPGLLTPMQRLVDSQEAEIRGAAEVGSKMHPFPQTHLFMSSQVQPCHSPIITFPRHCHSMHQAFGGHSRSKPRQTVSQFLTHSLGFSQALHKDVLGEGNIKSAPSLLCLSFYLHRGSDYSAYDLPMQESSPTSQW